MFITRNGEEINNIGEAFDMLVNLDSELSLLYAVNQEVGADHGAIEKDMHERLLEICELELEFKLSTGR